MRRYGFAPRYAGAGSGLRQSHVVDISAARVWSSGMGRACLSKTSWTTWRVGIHSVNSCFQFPLYRERWRSRPSRKLTNLCLQRSREDFAGRMPAASFPTPLVRPRSPHGRVGWLQEFEERTTPPEAESAKYDVFLTVDKGIPTNRILAGGRSASLSSALEPTRWKTCCH
jgi:hypothetical protein